MRHSVAPLAYYSGRGCKVLLPGPIQATPANDIDG